MSISDELSLVNKKRTLYNLRLRRRRNLQLGGDFVCPRCKTPFQSKRAFGFHRVGCNRLTETQLAWIMDNSEWSISTVAKPSKEWFEDPGIRPPPEDHQVPVSVTRSIGMIKSRNLAALTRKFKGAAGAPFNAAAMQLPETGEQLVFQPTPEDIVALVQLILGMYKPR